MTTNTPAEDANARKWKPRAARSVWLMNTDETPQFQFDAPKNTNKADMTNNIAIVMREITEDLMNGMRDTITEFVSDFTAKNDLDRRFVFTLHRDGDPEEDNRVCVSIEAQTLETDKEYNKRVESAEKSAAQRAARRAAKEEEEIALLKKLTAKYGKQID